MAILFLVAILALSSPLVLCQPKCTEFTKDDTLQPPEWTATSFTMDMEIFSQEANNKVMQSVVYYSKEDELLRLSILDAGKSSDLYFNFRDKKILAVENDPEFRAKCTVKPFENSQELFTVGGPDALKNPLNFIRYLGKSGFGDHDIIVNSDTPSTARGIATKRYQSCQKYTSGTDSVTVRVEHHFSDGTWKMPFDQVIPIMMTVRGEGTLKGGKPVTLYHVYSFFNYINTVDSQKFETPPGVYCEGRRTAPLPELTGYIRYSAEKVNTLGIRNTEVVFDVTNKYGMFKTQSIKDKDTDKDLGARETLRDYLTGLSFDIDKDSCRILPIGKESYSLLFESEDNNGNVHQFTADQYFYNNNKFEYVGQRLVREIPCDVYITKTKSHKDNQDMILEIAFAPHNLRTWNDKVPIVKAKNMQLPLQVRTWKSTDAVGTTENLFHVDYAQMPYDIMDMDLSICFNLTAANFITLSIPTKRELITKYLDLFKWRTRQALADAAKVAWWRISGMHIYFTEDNTILDFTLLDVPPVKGDVENPMRQPPLAEATQNLKQVVLSGLDISVPSEDPNAKETTFVRINKEFQGQSQPSGDDSGYGAGSMAGLGIAMLLIGGAAGGAGTMYFLNKR